MTDFGVNHPGWLSFLKDFPSEGVYSARVENFLCYHRNRSDDVSSEGLLGSMISYFESKYQEQCEDTDERRYCANTLRGSLSILGRFWFYSGRGVLKTSGRKAMK